VVWTHMATGRPGDVVAYDTVHDTTYTPAASTNSQHFEQPAIGGRHIVFVRVGLFRDIDGLDDATGLSLSPPPTNDPAERAHPRSAGDATAYEDYGGGRKFFDKPTADISGYRIPTGQTFAIAPGPEPQETPDTDGTTVVWAATASAGSAIFAYDLATGV